MPTILIVEDDPDIRRLVGELMRREGFEVEEAKDAMAMDAVLSRVRPDMVILDLMLPGEDGLSICRRLSAKDSPSILMLTAKSDEIDRVVGLELGACGRCCGAGARSLPRRLRGVLRSIGLSSISTHANSPTRPVAR